MNSDPKSSVGNGQENARWFLSAQLTDFDKEQLIEVDSSPFQIGRRPGLSLTLPSPVVSGLHAELVIDEQGLIVRDLNSTNGTYCNKVRVTEPTRLAHGDLLQLADLSIRIRCETGANPLTDTGSEIQPTDFDGFFRSLVPHFQSIVSLKDGSVIGFEVLARSRVEGMKTPDEMFLAASRINVQAELSRNLRLIGFQKGNQLWQSPRLFINTHTEELSTFGLLDSLRKIREVNSQLPITLEIPEPESRDTEVIQRFRTVLEELKMSLAYDRFGLGQCRRAELELIRPEYVKFDMTLIREIHLAPKAQRTLLVNLVKMVREIGIVPVAVGVESEAEHQVCCEIGFELGQGYYYGRPAENVRGTASLDIGMSGLGQIGIAQPVE